MAGKLIAAMRLHDWWHFILPPILAFYFLGIQLSESNATTLEILSGLLKLLALAAPVAAYGFFLNEWTDISEDAAAGKSNHVVGLNPTLRGMFFAGISTCIVTAAICLDYSFEIRILLLVQLVALTLYSVHPFRMKRYPLTAVCLDSLYSGPLFFVIALLLSMGDAELKYLIVAFFFGLVKGFRSIIFHLVNDKQNDLNAGKKTFAQLISTESAQRTQESLWIIEVATLLFITYFSTALTFCLLLAGFVTIMIKRNFYSTSLEPSTQSWQQWLGELNSLYEIWFPIAVILGVFSPLGIRNLLIVLVATLFFFPYTRKIFHELYIALYNSFYFISDLYFVYTKPYFDIGKIFRKIFRK